EEAQALRQQLQAHFADAVLSQECQLSAAFSRNSGASLVVDFGLAQEFMRPLTTFDKMEGDPLVGLAGAMSDLRAGEAAVFQVLFKKTTHSWARDIVRAVSDVEGKSFFID